MPGAVRHQLDHGQPAALKAGASVQVTDVANGFDLIDPRVANEHRFNTAHQGSVKLLVALSAPDSLGGEVGAHIIPPLTTKYFLKVGPVVMRAFGMN